MDGKTFADQEMIIALGVTIDGHKVPLGFVQAASENERVCRQFVDALIDRGLQYQQGLLCLIDGSKGTAGRPHQGPLRICGHPTLSVAQTRECDRLSAQIKAARGQKGPPRCLRQGDLQRRQSRAAGPQTLPGADERFGTEQPRGRARRNPHPASPGTDAAAQTVVPHHQLYRIPQRHGRTAHP